MPDDGFHTQSTHTHTHGEWQVFSITATVHGGKTYGELAQNHWAEIGMCVCVSG
jgi:hypothetical protein